MATMLVSTDLAVLQGSTHSHSLLTLKLLQHVGINAMITITCGLQLHMTTKEHGFHGYTCSAGWLLCCKEEIQNKLQKLINFPSSPSLPVS